MVLLVAPAGYGKSVLLAQWAAARPERRVAWVSARRVGTDALDVARRLAAGLAAADPGLGRRLRRGPGSPDRLGADFVDHLVTELGRSGDLVVVIEDFEDLTATPVLAEIGEFAERLPPTTRLVLASRRAPAIGLHRARLHDEVVEIRQDELVMTEAHAREVVQRLSGCELRPDQARAITARTGGWPAGLQLAALSLRDREDVDRYLEEFSGDDRHVAEYLSDEVLDGMPPDDRDFLVATSVLDHLSADLCDAVTERSDSAAMLESLHRRSLFLAALDTHRSRYQCHPLFRDLLRYELRVAHPGEEVGLHRRAARWLAAAGDPSAAAAHHVAAGDWDALVALAQREGRTHWERGEAHVVLGWLEQLPADLVDDRPEVALTMAVLEVASGRALAAEDLAERTAQAHDLPPELEIVVELIRVTLVYHHSPPAAILRAAQRVIDLMPVVAATTKAPLGFTDVRGMASQAQGGAGRAELLLGHRGAARRWLEAALIDNRGAAWLVHVLGSSAYCEALAGHLDLAVGDAERALAIAAGTGGPREPSTADARFALAHVHTQRGDLRAATRELAEALAAARTNRREALVGVHRAEWAEWAVATSHPDGLAAVDAYPARGEPPLAPDPLARLTAAHARLLLAEGRAERADLVLAEHPGPTTSDLASAAAAVASARGDVGALRKVVENWPTTDAGELWSRLQRGVWTAVLLDVDGSRSEADRAVDDLVAEAEGNRHLQVFRDGGRPLARILRRRYLSRPSPYLRRVVEAASDAPVLAHSENLVEQLSERELEVLRYLPSRLSNAEIASRLYVSVNTLKTHLKAIYRKLGVTSRSGAVERAELLDLA